MSKARVESQICLAVPSILHSTVTHRLRSVGGPTAPMWTWTVFDVAFKERFAHPYTLTLLCAHKDNKQISFS